MSAQKNLIYQFGEFRFESDKLVLWHKDQLVQGITIKPLKILAALLNHRGEVVTYEQIISEVWSAEDQDSRDDTNIKPHVHALRKVFAEYEPNKNFIETITGRGYLFVKAEPEGAGSTGQPKNEELADPINDGSSGAAVPANTNQKDDSDSRESDINGGSLQDEQKRLDSFFGRNSNRTLFFGGILLLVVIAAVLLWQNYQSRQSQQQQPQPVIAKERIVISSPRDEEEIRRVIEDSQNYETLGVYANPQAFDERQLERYFVSTVDGGQEPQKIKDAVANLIQKGLHYGPESKRERFDFLYVNVYSPGDYAEAQTDESWYIPAYGADGTRDLNAKIRVQSKPNYYLRKFNGRWLIEENTTGRKKPASPAAVNNQTN